MHNLILRNKIITLLTGLLLLINIGNITAQRQTLEEQFKNPISEDAVPWTFWYWMYGAVTKEGITADLEAMKQIGLGGAYLMPIKSPADNDKFDFSPAYNQLSPEWWEMVRFAMEEADRLGLKLGMHVSDGFALAGGPWITPENSMQKVVWSETVVNGGKLKNINLALPEINEGYYRDIGLYAIPVDKSYDLIKPVPQVTSDIGNDDYSFLVEQELSKETFRSNDPCWIQFTYDKPFESRSIKIVPGGNNFQAQRLTVYASDDGVDFRKIKQLTPFRQGWQNTDENFTYSLPTTKAKYFRFYWTPDGTEPGAEDLDAAKWRPNLKIDKIFLSDEPKIENIEGKNGSVWRLSKRVKPDEISNQACINLDEVISVSLSEIKNNQLTTKLPRGKWKIVRLGHTSTGHRNATGGGGKGLESNKFSKEAVQIQLDNWFGAAFKKTDPQLARKVLKYLHVESWECGSQNWSDNFPDEFKSRRGYDLLPYLLVYTGIPINSADQTESILHDIRQTVAELVVDVFYTTLAEFTKELDCEISAENVSPTMMSDGLLHFQKVDRPMGEFWLQSPTHDKFNDMLDAISGAHIYGKKLIQAEGFTQLRTMWNENPRLVKTLLDRQYGLGINKLFHHVYALDPYLDKQPSMTLDGIGFSFQRKQTWWDYSNAWIDYIARCQTLLQYGNPVIDIAVFSGEETPRRALLPERLVESLPGIFGKEQVQTERDRIANAGQPLRVMPVGVTHSANVTDAGDWIDALNGYQYDSFNKDALLRLSKVENQQMYLAGGIGYKIVVLPKPYSLSPEGEYMSVEVAEKIRELQQNGVTVLLGNQPAFTYGFLDKENSNSKLQTIAGEIWNAPSQYHLPYTNDDFTTFGLEKDLDLFGEKDVAWTHRAGDGVDIYFISNQKEELRNLKLSFRVDGKEPELWDPVTGVIAPASHWNRNNRRTEVQMQLHPNQSMFVVFRNPTTQVESRQVVQQEVIPLQIEDWNIVLERDASVNLTRAELFDWSKEEDLRLKYYAGTAVYQTQFDWEGEQGDSQVFLNLGEVYDLAEVVVNGINCGTIWTSPNRANISDALKKGKNELKIRVVNGWTNRMKGFYENKIDDPTIWTNTPNWISDFPLQKSGLLGPLTIESVKN